MIEPPKGLNSIVNVFGDLGQYVNEHGVIPPEQEVHFLTIIDLPFWMTYAFDPRVIIKRMKCHKLMGDIFFDVFRDLMANNLQQFLHFYGGCYVYRESRTSHKLSTHSWGIAVDFNPNTNRLGTVGDMNQTVVSVFKNHGFTWGGDFHSTKDPMHFQYCSGY